MAYTYLLLLYVFEQWQTQRSDASSHETPAFVHSTIMKWCANGGPPWSTLHLEHDKVWDAVAPVVSSNDAVPFILPEESPQDCRRCSPTLSFTSCRVEFDRV